MLSVKKLKGGVDCDWLITELPSMLFLGKNATGGSTQKMRPVLLQL
jgi:hypothetical protein